MHHLFSVGLEPRSVYVWIMDDRGAASNKKISTLGLLKGIYITFSNFPCAQYLLQCEINSHSLSYQQPDHFNNSPFQGAMERERKLPLDTVLFKQKEMVSEPQKTNKHASTWNFTSICLLSGTKRCALT